MHKLLYNSLLISIAYPKFQQYRGDHFAPVANAAKGFAKRLSHNRLARLALLLLLIVSAIGFLGVGAQNALKPTGSHDLQWTPVRALVNGINPYAEFMQWKDNDFELTPPHYLNQSPSYPASAYVILAPLAALDWNDAKVIWMAANFLFTALLIAGLQKLYPIPAKTLLIFVVLMFLCASPLRRSIAAGQHNLLSLAAFIWAYYYSQRNTKSSVYISSIFLSIAWIKYSITFPLTLLFVARGRYKPILFASAIHAILTAIAAWKIGQWPHEFFFDSVQVVLMGEGTGFFSISALAIKLNLPVIVAIATIVLAGFYVLRNLPKHEYSDDLKLLSFLALFSFAVFFHHGYDFIVLIFCAWALANHSLKGSCATGIMAVLFLAWYGQWAALELSLQVAAFGAFLPLVVELALIVALYSTLWLIWTHLRCTTPGATQPQIATTQSQVAHQF